MTLDNTFEATNAFGLYQQKLLNGWDFGADLAFFPMEGFSIGAVYTDFTSSNSATNLNFINQISSTEASGSISNRISTKFIGPAIFLRKSMDYKTFVVLSLSPGLNLYSDKGEYNGVEFNFRGQEFGAAASLGLDFLLGNDIVGRDITLSLEAGYNRGKINGLNYGNGSGEILLDNPILLDRVDFSIGLRFMRFPKYLKKELLRNYFTVKVKLFGGCNLYLSKISKSHILIGTYKYFIINLWRIKFCTANKVIAFLSVKKDF